LPETRRPARDDVLSMLWLAFAPVRLTMSALGSGSPLANLLIARIKNKSPNGERSMPSILMRSSVCALTAHLLATGAQAQLAPNPTLSVQGVGLTAAIGGVGLSPVRNGNISVLVNGPVQAAFLYWNGDGAATGPQELNFDGTVFAGTLIGSEPAGGSVPQGYRADVTAKVQAAFGALGPGVLTFNAFDPSPVDNLERMHGAGLFVVYTDPTDPNEYRLITYDGVDFAWAGYVGPTAVTQPVSFLFDAIGADRSAELMVFVGECTADRPDRIDVSGNPSIVNGLNSSDGNEFDADVYAINIASGANSATVEVVSPAGNFQSDSLIWQLGALRIPVTEEQGGGEGCTPGYWKQPHHFDSWPAPYTPNMLFSSVFENAYPGKTLLQVLQNNGNTTGLDALGRHTVAALLNSASGNVNYDLTTQNVISMFNDVFPGKKSQYNALKDIFEGFNTRGCPLN